MVTCMHTHTHTHTHPSRKPCGKWDLKEQLGKHCPVAIVLWGQSLGGCCHNELVCLRRDSRVTLLVVIPWAQTPPGLPNPNLTAPPMCLTPTPWHHHVGKEQDTWDHPNRATSQC